MKNKKTWFIALPLMLVIIAIAASITINVLNDPSRLTSEEKNWITKNTSTIQNVNVLNNVEIVGKNGSGVFFDFIKDIKNEYNITINPITYNNGEQVGDKSFKIVNEINDNHLVFKEEHFVLVGLPGIEIVSTDNSKIGVLKTDLEYVSKYLDTNKITLVESETTSELYDKLKKQEEINYIMVPLDEELSKILMEDYSILKHYSDIKKYFVYEMPEKKDVFSNILKKYYYRYSDKKLEKEINKNTLSTFVNALNISEKDLKEIQANEYNYGFINNSPYEVLIGGNYGGIVSEYIRSFSNVTNTEFKFTKYKNNDSFIEALNDGKIDIFFNYYDFNTKYNNVTNGLDVYFNILTSIDDYEVYNSVESLRGKTVYVKSQSMLYKYLNDLGYIDVKDYNGEKQLEKIIKKNSIIVLDKREYDYYSNTKFKKYTVKYSDKINDTYTFKVRDKNVFYTLFTKYISTLDSKEVINRGIYNHSVTVKSGTIAGKIAEYSLVIIAVIIVVLIIIYRSSRKIKIVKKIKKEDKIKYIDQLTSLKNRNYLTENISSWNNNTIYPQSTIVIDLDSLQNINDTLGYEAGDAQIKAAANILIKTQLDNSDIVRTDGNEFLIYLVGYQEKQIVGYIRKLYKEFKSLPHEYGATIGYSMITDDIKTIEDAINEAVDDMKNKKEEQE